MPKSSRKKQPFGTAFQNLGPGAT